MRYSPKQYASALNAAIKNKDAKDRKEIVRRFLGILSKNRDSVKLGRILKDLEMQHLRESDLRKVKIESASPLSSKVRSEIKDIFKKDIYLEEEINPKLLAGLRILVDEELFIDASAKRRIGEMLGA